MLISKKINDAINQQIGNEFGASLQYVAIATHFDREALARPSVDRRRTCPKKLGNGEQFGAA